MKKAIHIEHTGRRYERVLSIAEPFLIECNPTGAEYFLIEDFTEPPAVGNQALDINYPMYDTVDKKFIWVPVNYMYTATTQVLEMQNLKADVEKLTAENKELRDTVETIMTVGKTTKEEREQV